MKVTKFGLTGGKYTSRQLSGYASKVAQHIREDLLPEEQVFFQKFLDAFQLVESLEVAEK